MQNVELKLKQASAVLGVPPKDLQNLVQLGVICPARRKKVYWFDRKLLLQAKVAFYRSASLPARRRKRPRGVVDTSVLVAGIAGFKAPPDLKNSSALFLREWIENDTFFWLLNDDIPQEYKAVLARLGVRRALLGRIINLLREEAEFVPVSAAPDISPDPDDVPFCACAERGLIVLCVLRG